MKSETYFFGAVTADASGSYSVFFVVPDNMTSETLTVITGTEPNVPTTEKTDWLKPIAVIQDEQVGTVTIGIRVSDLPKDT